MPSVFTLEGVQFGDEQPAYRGADGQVYLSPEAHVVPAEFGVTEDEPWHHKRPWLGFVVALGGPIVIGGLLVALMSRVPVFRRS